MQKWDIGAITQCSRMPGIGDNLFFCDEFPRAVGAAIGPVHPVYQRQAQPTEQQAAGP